MRLSGLNNQQIYKVDVCGPNPPRQVIIRKYYACVSANHHHMDQPFLSDGSLDSDLAQGLNQWISVSAQRCQQAPNRNVSLCALQLPQNLVVLSHDLMGSRCPL